MISPGSLGMVDSVEDLNEELKRYQLKCKMLKEELETLKQEKEINKPIEKNTEESLQSEIKRLNKLLLHEKDINIKISNKLTTTSKILNLQKDAISEIRCDVNNTKLTNDSMTKLLNNVVTTREIAWKNDLNKEKVNNNKLLQLLGQEKDNSKVKEENFEEVIKKLERKILDDDNDHKKYNQSQSHLIEELEKRVKMTEEKLIESNTDNNNLTTSNTSLESTNKRLVHEKEKSNNNIKDLQDKLTHIDSEFSSLQTVVDDLKMEKNKIENLYNNLLSKYKILENDSVNNNNEGKDIRLRLKQIQEKVRTLECEHSNEISRLNEIIGKKDEGLNKLLNKYNASVTDSRSFEDRVIELEMKIKLKDNDQLEKDNEILLLKRKIDESNCIISNNNNRIKELETDNESVRKDRNEYESKYNQITVEKDNYIKNIKEYKKQIEVLLKKQDEIENNNIASKDDKNKILNLSSKVSSLESELNEKMNDIDGLKDTIRRECEERTDMLIEISELRDEIHILKKNSNSSSSSSSSSSRGGMPLLRSESNPTLSPTSHLPNINNNYNKSVNRNGNNAGSSNNSNIYNGNDENEQYDYNNTYNDNNTSITALNNINADHIDNINDDINDDGSSDQARSMHAAWRKKVKGKSNNNSGGGGSDGGSRGRSQIRHLLGK